MIARRATEPIRALLQRYPVVALLGARQVGKTTLAREIARSDPTHTGDLNHFDLENPVDRQRLREPMLALEPLRGLVVLDEIQRAPDLFPLLRVLADRPGEPARFLILGSASRDLIRQSSESLAGRIAYHPLDPFDIGEVGADASSRLWLRGGFPRSYLAPTEEGSADWRDRFTRTFLEQDVPSFGFQVSSESLRRCWAMLAHYHGQVLNASEIGRSLGVSHTTIAHYVDILVGCFMVRRLAPWHENLAKRQVKSPKLYFADSGILHRLMGITTWSDLQRHPKLGASWEGYALAQVERALGVDPSEAHFWATHADAELDYLLVHGEHRFGFEFKYGDAPGRTRSMATAHRDLGLRHLYVVYPGPKAYALDAQTTVIPLADAVTRGTELLEP